MYSCYTQHFTPNVCVIKAVQDDVTGDMVSAVDWNATGGSNINIKWNEELLILINLHLLIHKRTQLHQLNN